MGFQFVVMFSDSFTDDVTYVKAVEFIDSFMDDVTYVKDVEFIDSFMDDVTYVKDVEFIDSFMDDVTYVKDVEVCLELMICYIPGFICCGSENFALGSLHDDYVGLAGATPQFYS
jgi:hypothetical protein